MPTPPSLCLITVWSGPLPAYLNLFLLSAAANADVDFVIVADASRPDALLDGGMPTNVRWVQRPYPDLLQEMGRRLDLALPDAPAYKACDYKPAFGVALEPYLLDRHERPADFWGYLDCDTFLAGSGTSPGRTCSRPTTC